MARRSSGGRSASRMAPRPSPVRNPPQPASRAPPPAPAQNGASPASGGFVAAVADGMAFGTGSAIAHRAVDAVLGPRTIQHETVVSAAPSTVAVAASPVSSTVGSDACTIQSKAFQDCISSYGSDISKCQFYLDMLNVCQRSSGSVLSA